MLERISDYNLAIKGTQYFAVSDFLNFINSNVSGNSPNSIVHIDHWFCYAFEKFERGSTKSYDWFEEPLFSLQVAENEIMLNNRNCTVFRHFLIPHPRYFNNVVNIHIYRELILSVLHLQLSLGNMVFAHFIDPIILSKIDAEKIFQITILPLLGIACSAQGFHTGKYQALEIIYGPKLIDIANIIKEILLKRDSVHFLSYYDENYESKCLSKSKRNLWNRIRLFYWDMWQPEKLCYLCKFPIQSFELMDLDHLVPTNLGGTNILSNLRPTHSKCNRSRQNDAYYRPSMFKSNSGRLFDNIESIHKIEFKPNWLGKITRPDWRSNIFKKSLTYDLK